MKEQDRIARSAWLANLRMKHTYFDSESGAEADLMDWREHGWVITRIVVPEKFRGKGVATKLLKEIIADADAENVSLILEVQPEGGLSSEELISWYTRYGFIQQGRENFYKRNPK